MNIFHKKHLLQIFPRYMYIYSSVDALVRNKMFITDLCKSCKKKKKSIISQKLRTHKKKSFIAKNER